MTTKHQTQAQRVANPVWLRAQIQGLIRNCDDNIEEDLALADVRVNADTHDKYLARVESDRYWKRQLERILAGRTLVEDLRTGCSPMRPRIHLIVERPGGRDSAATIDGAAVTPALLDAAEDLLTTLTTGERPPIKGLYELCALAFGTTREDAKQRLVGAAYGKRGKAVVP